MAASPRGPSSRRARAAVVAALSTLAVAGPAAAAPATLSTPADNAPVTTRPTFSWDAAVPDVLRYEVYVEFGGTDQRVATTTPTVLSATSTVELPDDSRLTWYVKAVRAIGFEDSVARTIVVASPPGAPNITGAPPSISNNPAPLFTWSGSRYSSRWSIVNASGLAIRSGEVPSGSGQVAPAALPDGSYQFRVAQTNLADADGPPASTGFSIDTAAPGPLALRRSTSRPDSRAIPAYTFGGQERGALVTWRVVRRAGGTAQGPLTTSANGITLTALKPATYVFEARQTDLAGNAGPLASDDFVLLPRLAAGIRLPMRNTKRLSPQVGSTVSAVRPRLRWTAGPRGTRIYNVQVFRVENGAKLKQVLSLFPRRQQLKVPRRKALVRGSCYVWRVWPFRGARATPTPLGVSHFCVSPK